jgi:hypothetical protein
MTNIGWLDGTDGRPDLSAASFCGFPGVGHRNAESGGGTIGGVCFSHLSHQGAAHDHAIGGGYRCDLLWSRELNAVNDRHV